MFPSEAEIEARLRDLRQRREAIDREIADLALYRELGLRLSRVSEGTTEPEPESRPEASQGETIAAARRHGRALLAAATEILHAAGRPLHAGEVWRELEAQGFDLPGHDPVAALNTRLWKRSGPGGPLRRLGDGVYAPAEEDEGT